jgi:serine/threonine protein phosphatase 1
VSPLPVLRELKIDGRLPSLPPELRIYAVGDIHGRLDLLDMLLARLGEDLVKRPAERPIFLFLGDYIDRGAQSRETIDRLIEFKATHECIFIKGNHEAIALRCLSDRSLFEQWMRLGGRETLLSYGVGRDNLVGETKVVQLQSAFHHALPQSHLRFFRDLQNSFQCGDFFFSHAGARPHVELSRQKESDLLWIRDEFLSSTYDFGKIIVHGHTPVKEIEVKPNRINIDTGAFATGRLTCLAVDCEHLCVIEAVSAA